MVSSQTFRAETNPPISTMVKRASTFTPETLLSAPRRSVGVPNSNGTKVLYTVSSYDFHTHSKTSDFRILDVASGESQPIHGGKDVTDPNWLNDNEVICLAAGIGDYSSLQVYTADSDASGGLRLLVSFKLCGPASNLKVTPLHDEEWSETGCFGVVLSAPASPDGRMSNPSRAKPTQASGRLYSSLFVRHWDHYETKERNALFYGKLSTGGHKKYQLSGLINALTGVEGLECPIIPFGGTDHFDVCELGIVFVSKDPELDPALNTKSKLYLRRVRDWSTKGTSEQLTCFQPPDFEGAITSPVFSSLAMGVMIAFLAMRTNGYEADQNHLFLVDPAFSSSPFEAEVWQPDHLRAYDRSPSGICFSPDDDEMVSIVEEAGYARLFLNDMPSPVLMGDESVTDVKWMKDGRLFVTASSFLDSSLYMIVEDPRQNRSERLVPAWRHSSSGHGNKFGLKEKQVSSIWTPASNPRINPEVHSWVVKPSFFDPSKKYPVAYLIHGGPQGAWTNSWSTRWNPVVFAEQGYIVVAPNPTGSTGYGQAFTDSIRGNWGGDPYQDIVNVFQWVGEYLPQADNGNAVALGASYGGYMMWVTKCSEMLSRVLVYANVDR